MYIQPKRLFYALISGGLYGAIVKEAIAFWVRAGL